MQHLGRHSCLRDLLIRAFQLFTVGVDGQVEHGVPSANSCRTGCSNAHVPRLPFLALTLGVAHPSAVGADEEDEDEVNVGATAMFEDFFGPRRGGTS